MSNSQRPALGQDVPLGTVYDAFSGAFLDASILPKELPADTVVTVPLQKSVFATAKDGTRHERFRALGIDADTSASILAGQIRPRAAGVYLLDHTQSVQTDSTLLTGAVSYKRTTVHKKLSLHSPSTHGSMNLDPLQSHRATHIVVGIVYGMHSVFEMTHRVDDKEQPTDTREAFDADLDRLRTVVEQIAASPSGSKAPSLPQMQLEHKYMLFSDHEASESFPLEDLDNACRFVQFTPKHIKQSNKGDGWPLSFVLLPVSMLHHFSPSITEMQIQYTSIDFGHIAKFCELLDDYSTCRVKLRGYRQYLSLHRQYVEMGHFEVIENALASLHESRAAVTKLFDETLVLVRSGGRAPSILSDLCDCCTSQGYAPGCISAPAGRDTAYLDFVVRSVANGAKYVGYNGLDLQRVSELAGGREHYIFLFNRLSPELLELWRDNVVLINKLLSKNQLVYVVDCDAISLSLESNVPRICRYERNCETTCDLLEKEDFMAQKCLVQFPSSRLDHDVKERPVNRRFIKVPCPNKACDPTRICEWTCSHCLAPIESGFEDDFIYCDCGRVRSKYHQFKCNGEHHGSRFVHYHLETLRGLLDKLDQSDYLNILILGETGVGKSTFINAFVNYMTYSSLDEAKSMQNLVSVIPCSFSVQHMDRDDPSRPIQEILIKVGGRDDEADGARGDSATQQTNVYSINIGSTTYRLIDTPGIGDTRGLSYDKKNMSDILRTLSSYENIHGILVLLKSNNARLTVNFRFCLKELLVHLHRSAAHNIAFGFTNTRISNYAPGDSFGPLKSLLQEDNHAQSGIELSTKTTYCFDSESFRYLAAFKNGTTMPNEEDFVRSWKHSRVEAQRLIEFFKTRKPHSIRSTLSINGTRQVIMELTKPMAEISKLITDNIAMLEDQTRELEDTRLSGDDLRSRLMIEKVQFMSKQLERPRTVCKNTACCDFKQSGKGDNETVTIYKKHCHRVCYLDNVQQDVVAHPGLINCAAFRGSSHCYLCGHHWQEHMHVLYELEEVKVQVTDTEIQRQLKVNADDVDLRQTGIGEIKKLIQEYKDEHWQIREASVRFSLYFKAHAITPINDATLDYLDMLIKDEEAKIEAGKRLDQNVTRNQKRINALLEDKASYIELEKTLKASMESPQKPGDRQLDEQGVAELESRLYALRHFGKNLEAVRKTITSAHKATNRERPFRVPQCTGRKAHVRAMISRVEAAKEEVAESSEEKKKEGWTTMNALSNAFSKVFKTGKPASP